jgi:HAD superfamily hydrolase (TIGR01509 family)
MIKLIIFDNDGTLMSTRDMHYEALNKAIAQIYPPAVIERAEHLSTFDGMSTSKKLTLLSETKGLPYELHHAIWELKQKYTEEEIRKYKIDYRMRSILSQLKTEGYKIAVASNSIRDNLRLMLECSGLLPYVDFFMSNQDVTRTKPNPEMYLKCMVHESVGPKETLIVEDSHIGRKAALDSGAFLCPVNNPYDVTYEKIKSYLNIYGPETMPKWRGGSMNIVIPMAGKGSRFSQAGYTFPKPLIPVNKMNGKPMIQVVAENLNTDAKYIYIVQKEHYEKYHLKTLLNLITPNCEIIQIDEVTEGAACTVLLAEKYINNDAPLFIANSDQFVEWNSNEFFYSMQGEGVDAGMATFTSCHPKWSFAKLDDDGFVCEVAEKNPISDIASVGFYYFRKGKDFVSAAKKMIIQNKRVNNEFYVCPVLNEIISEKKKVKIFPIKRMWSLGTPEDLEYFEEHYQEK